MLGPFNNAARDVLALARDGMLPAALVLTVVLGILALTGFAPAQRFKRRRPEICAATGSSRIEGLAD